MSIVSEKKTLRHQVDDNSTHFMYSEGDRYIIDSNNLVYDLKKGSHNRPMVPVYGNSVVIEINSDREYESNLYEESVSRQIVNEFPLKNKERSKSKDKARRKAQMKETSLVEEVAIGSKNYKVPQKKHLYSFAVSTIILAITISIGVFNFFANSITMSLFWGILSLPILGISSGTFLILLGEDKEKYFVDGEK